MTYPAGRVSQLEGMYVIMDMFVWGENSGIRYWHWLYCDLCELGVQSVTADQYNQKVIVTGNADPALVLSYVKKAKKRSQFWDENVNYSQNYQKYIDLLDEDKRRADIARAQAVEAEEAAIAHAYLQSQMNYGVQNVIVQLPKDENGPNVTVILPNAVPA